VAYTIGLTITSKDGKTKDAVFDSESVLIGSGPSAVLRLEEEGISSIHAVIKVSAEGEATVIDLGSERGTTVNGNAVSEPVVLTVGDTIRVGEVDLEITELEARAPATRAQPGDDGREAAPAPGPADRRGPKAHELAEEEATVQVTDKKKTDTHHEQSTLEAAEAFNHQPEPKAGDHIVDPNASFEEHLLKFELADENKPTNEHRVLEVTVLWGDTVIDAVQVKEPRDVVVASRTSNLNGKADLEVDGFPADRFVIAHNQGGEAQIVVPTDAKVGLRKTDGKITKDVTLAGTDAPFPAKAYQLKLGERLVYKTGTLTVMAEFIRGDARMGAGAVMDWFFPRLLTIVALLHVFFVVAAFLTPQLNSGLVDDLFKNQNRFAQMILKAPEKEKKRKKLDLSGMKGGAKHKDDEGKFGKKDKPKKDAVASKAGAPRVDPNKREKDRKIALNSGLLGMLSGKAGAVSNVFGPGGLGTGINNAMGGLRGAEMGDAGGAGGLGTRGTGAGGGGNSLGIGGLGTHGHGRGTGGYGNIDLGGRGKGTTRIVPGRTIIKGSLTKEEIGRVIRRNLARFKFCYEKQLNANPNLSGKISVYFTIAPTGSVANASVRETTMNDANVESCVEKVMRSLQFPKPRGGGIVVVTYPFVFAAT
jgi:pSer/pThr/pTyr-binding forkhead associated (FHA) protein